MPIKQSIYKTSEHQRDNLLHQGYQYRGNIFRNTMSKFMFREEKRAAILGYMEEVVFNLIEKVKHIKNHVNYCVPKDSDKN